MEYASLLFRQAAVNYERDMEFASFSECFYDSRECLRRFLFRSLITRKEIHYIGISGIKKKGSYGILKRLGLFIFLTLSSLIWGHGERPHRTFYSAILLISLSAILYTFGQLVNNTAFFKPNLFQAFYFSVVTFTTVGYGDITASGFTKIIACLEAFCGIFVIPIFIVGLSRKYLRI